MLLEALGCQSCVFLLSSFPFLPQRFCSLFSNFSRQEKAHCGVLLAALSPQLVPPLSPGSYPDQLPLFSTGQLHEVIVSTVILFLPA